MISIHALREEGDLIVGDVNIQFPISIHALREEGDNGFCDIGLLFRIFLSTPSARRATAAGKSYGRWRYISIHALREEGDFGKPVNITSGFNFYPRPPRGGRHDPETGDLVHIDISIHALREEGDMRTLCAGCPAEISIHALREEGDHRAEKGRSLCYISIHALREEGDPTNLAAFADREIFLSTPSARRATTLRITFHSFFSNFYPRPPRGGRPVKN